MAVVDTLDMPKKHKGHDPCLRYYPQDKVTRFYVQVSAINLMSLPTPVTMDQAQTTLGEDAYHDGSMVP
jgi:hypothetical protein